MKIRSILVVLLLSLFTSCDKDKDITIPLRTVDVVGYGNDFKLEVRMASWETDQYTEVIGNDSTNIRLTYVQVPDTLKVRSNGNKIIVYS